MHTKTTSIVLSTMRLLKRNISAVHEELLEQNNTRVRDTSIVDTYILLQNLSQNEESTKFILRSCFHHMNEHTWYTVIKNTDENILNMSYGFNFKYEHLLALFIDLGYVVKKDDLYVFQGKNVDSIKSEFNEGFDLHFTSCRVGSKKRVWYICKTHPDFTTVRQQQKHTIRNKIAPLQLPFPSRNVSTL